MDLFKAAMKPSPTKGPKLACGSMEPRAQTSSTGEQGEAGAAAAEPMAMAAASSFEVNYIFKAWFN
jgi:hypothetical protein